MENEFLIRAVEAAIATRKLRKLIYQQGNKTFSPRAQAHVFIVDHPGQGKSTIGREIEECLKKTDGFEWIECITEAGLKGTISKEGIYSPGKIEQVGGKVLFVDEFNTISYSEFPGFLSLLENQRFSKAIAYNVRGHITQPDNPYLTLTVEKGEIKGNCIFSCIACAMEFPDAATFSRVVAGRSVMDAILQRFIIINLDSDFEDALDLLDGKRSTPFNDFSGKAETITITKKAYSDFLRQYKKEVRDNFDNDFESLESRRKGGFYARAFNDIIRLSIPQIIAKDMKAKDIVVKSTKPLVDNLHWIYPMWLNYSTAGEKSNYREFCNYYKDRTDAETLRDIAGKVGCSYRQALRYKKRYEKSHPIDLGLVK